MAADANVGLDVRIGPRDGYTQAAFQGGTSNPGNFTYYYKYSGGTDGNGNVVESGRGAVDIFLTLSSDPRYVIDYGGFGAGNTQLSFTRTDNTHATIHDVNTADESDYFNVRITDTGNGNCQFWCDPRVTNQD